MNPEFERNLWLEAAPGRIAWAGVALGVIYGLTALSSARAPELLGAALGTAGVVVFGACGLIWGARAAGGSVLNEIGDRTWDFQRLSALDPWSMTWGKLFGAASLAWLCALTGLAMVGVSLAWRERPDAVTTPLFMVALALLVQAICMAAALIGVRKARAEGRTARSAGVAGGLLIGVVLLFGVATSEGFQHGAGLSDLSRLFSSRGDVAWWGLVVPASGFRLAAAAAFAAWALAGAWRLMRLELQMQNAPLVWPAFLVFLAAFTGGLVYPGGGLPAAQLTGALVCALCAYAAAFAEPADRVRLRLFASSVAHRAWTRALRLAPAAIWPVVLAVLLTAKAFATAAITGHWEIGPQLWQAAGLMAFMLRDLGVIAFHRFGPRPQRGDFGAVLTLALLYLAGGILGNMGGHGGGVLFAPLPGPPGLSLISGAVQAAVAWWLAARRIKAPEARAAG
ncbi:hypothetical protein [Phenylobacterium sp.]|jgi:hypothetical protein|uniref:hypothetical protein n=1 Tax=Phenylobacterium sp. TaxID=1871053 RepID=UPI002F3E34EB